MGNTSTKITDLMETGAESSANNIVRYKIIIRTISDKLLISRLSFKIL